MSNEIASPQAPPNIKAQEAHPQKGKDESENN